MNLNTKVGTYKGNLPTSVLIICISINKLSRQCNSLRHDFPRSIVCHNLVYPWD